jgi:hypothetical protein
LKAKNISEANYIDLTDTVGWQGALEQISHVCLGSNSKNIHEFVGKMEDAKSQKSVCIGSTPIGQIGLI